MSQTETLTVAPSTGINAFSLGRGADKVAVCHVPDGNDAHDAVYMEVGAKAADQHVANHEGDRIVSLGSSCDSSWASLFLAMDIAPYQYYETWCGLPIYTLGRWGENEWYFESTSYDLEGLVAHFESTFGSPPESCQVF